MRWIVTLVALVAMACGTQVVLPPDPPLALQPRLASVEKVDLLFMIDNSASMGDKHELLVRAIPDLVTRLLLPYCVLKSDGTTVVPREKDGSCPPTARNEFDPVHDLHLAIVTSSLGGGGGDMCPANATISQVEIPELLGFSRHNDDRGHLVNRQKPDLANVPPNMTEEHVADADPTGFLAWLPEVPDNAGAPKPPVKALGDPLAGVPPTNTLIQDFQKMVRGTQDFGCGLEAQMESWYRFLVQPDPWDSIQLDTGQSPPAAQLVGVDKEILQQRHDFLRPDSLVGVIVISDEEDSWSDPMWLRGRGWITRSQDNTFTKTGQLPRGTTPCSAPIDPNNPSATGPNDPACRWCAFVNMEQDPNCANNKGIYAANEDGLNVRYTDDMKRRYGIDPQFPIERYVDGLKSALVPDRQGEHFDMNGKLSDNYVGRKTCRNPLFAADLPTDPNGELCKLKPGSRTPDLVFFSVIGGVPWQLLTEDASVPSASFKDSLTDADWVRLVGKNPALYDRSGIDPHMIESITPRDGIACGTTAPSTCDAMHGREWKTRTSKVGIDLQYACTFELPRAKDCTKSPDGATCDCGGSYDGPLCAPNPNDGGNLTLQTRGKAYPTIRALRIAKAMGDRGSIASICPRTLDENSDDYGYRPAMRAIVNRFRAALGPNGCLASTLPRSVDGSAACSLLVELPSGDQATACGPIGQPDAHGLQQPGARVLDWFRKSSGSTLPVCELVQIAPDPDTCPSCTFSREPTCADSGKPGWCYVEGAASNCPKQVEQAIHFGITPVGKAFLQCVQNGK